MKISDFKIEDGILVRYTGSGSEAVVPQGVTVIENLAFDNSQIEKVILPETLREIGSWAFCQCVKLKSITFPESLRTIGEKAFKGCTGLERLCIPKWVKNVGPYAFLNCEGLQSVDIKGGRKVIGNGAFINTTDNIYGGWDVFRGIRDEELKLTMVRTFAERLFDGADICQKDMDSYGRYIKSQCAGLYDAAAENRALMWYMTSHKAIPKRDIDFVAEKVSCCDIEIKSLIMEYQRENIPVSQRLKNEEEKERAELTGVLPVHMASGTWKYEKTEDGSVRLLGYKGRDRDVTVPRFIGKDRVTEIGVNAFNPMQDGIQSRIKSSRNRIESITVPEGIISIGTGAFAECESLVKAELPDSCISLGSFAFSNCWSLETVRLPSNLKEIKESTFCGCEEVKSITLPMGIEKIGRLAFADCINTDYIFVPSSVYEIGKYAFGNFRGVVLSDREGSEIERYASEYGLDFKVIKG